MKIHILSTCLVLGMADATFAVVPDAAKVPDKPAEIKDIKAYCIDFNWHQKHLADPGMFAATDPADHLAWYKMLGVNVIQTFCVSTNGYAWYKNGFVPEQPGLKHDFLPEMVKLGHQEGMLVMGYFTIGCNPRWAELRPDQSYGGGKDGEITGGYHIVYTDDYLDFLSKSITDSVSKTGIDGFMIDWVWQPSREITHGKWIDSEKKLYKQLTGEPYPGDDALTVKQELTYSRMAIDRCWKTIRKAAKEANPNCIIWITSNNMDHPHVVDSDMYREADWLMNESGDMARINKVKGMVGEHTRLITCMAAWNGADAARAVPEALKAGVGLYGFSVPGEKTADNLANLLERPVSELKGDDRNMASLARAYNGVSLDTVRNNKGEWLNVPTAKASQKPTATKPESSKPNIVLITADDLAWTDYSFMDNAHVNTPHLEKLANSGVLFKRGYVPTAWNRASLMTLATGHYAHEHGITVDNLVSLNGAGTEKPRLVSTIGRYETLPSLLKEQGYLCRQSGRWFEGSYEDGGFTHGTARGVEKGGIPGAYDKPGIGPNAVKECADFIDMAVKEKKPFFLWYAPALPAYNFSPRMPAAQEDAVPTKILENQKFVLGYDIDKYYLQFQKVGDRSDITKYYALIEWFDEHCGKLIAHLEEKGIRDDTLIVYLSANGWVSIRRQRDYAPRSKGSAYDAGVRSPIICSWPARIKPGVSASLTSSVDVVPTILAAAGARTPKKQLPGMNLLPVLEGQESIDDRAIFGEVYERDIANIEDTEAVMLKRWVIHKGYKLILTCAGKDEQKGGIGVKHGMTDSEIAPEIYDLLKDPFEQTNLYGELPKVYEDLRARLDS